MGFIGKSIPSVHKPTQELLIIFPLYFSVSSCLECRVTAVLYIKRFLSRHSFKNAMRYLQPHDFSDLLDIFLPSYLLLGIVAAVIMNCLLSGKWY